MAEKTIYKNVIVFELLSNSPLTGKETHEDIDSLIYNGDVLHRQYSVVDNKAITGMNAVAECAKYELGDGFFNMDENGNELE